MFKLSEKIPIEKALFLYDMKFSTFKHFVKRCSNDGDRKEQFNKVKKLCKEVIDNLGTIERHYDFSTNQKDNGRLFSVDGGIQGIMREVRGFLLSHTTDIDMKNAHPTILHYLCKKHSIPCPNLEYYINNRDTILAEFPDREEGKNAFLKSLNFDKINKNISISAFRKFDVEVKKIQKSITELPDYKDIVKNVDDSKKFNIVGSQLNGVLCHYENKILQTAVNYLLNNNHEIACFMFDGCNVYGDLYGNNEILTNVAEVCNKDFEGLNIQWSFKKHEDIIKIPVDWKPDILGTKDKKKETPDIDEKKLITDLVKKYLPFEYLTRTEGTIRFIETYQPNKFIWVRGCLYCWTGVKWEKNTNEFVRFILREGCDILDGLFKKATDELNPLNKDHKNVLGVLESKIDEAKFYFKDINYVLNVIKGSIAFFSRDDIDFDDNDDLLGFNNGVYDLKKHEFRPYNYDDYMTMSCGYDYNPIIDLSKKKALENLLLQIMPVLENRRLLLQVISAGLTGRCIEKFIMFNGDGRNGKGLLDEFVMLLLGDYQFIYANVSLLTEVKKTGPNPELASLNKKRYVAFKEPDSGIPLHNDCVKDLTGGGNVSARMCHSNDTLTKLTNITVFECNERPKFNSEPTNAEFERLVDLEFPNRFTTEESEVDNITVFKANSLYKTNEWKLEHRDAFLQILIENFKQLQTNNYVFDIPENVKQRSREYLNSSFPILEIFYEHYVKTGVDTDIVKLKDICEVIKNSPSYYNFDKKQKRKYNNKYIYTFIEKNRSLRKDFRDRLKINYVDCFSLLVGYKVIVDYSCVINVPDC